MIRLASESTSGKRIELPGKITVRRSFGELVFQAQPSASSAPRTKETAGRNAAYQYAVTLTPFGTTAVSVPELKSRFQLKVIDWSSAERDTTRAATALDADLLQHPVYLRTWRPGDAYRPLGHRRSKKLKEMFLEARVPIQERYTWPIIESRGRIAWVRNMPPAQEFCVHETSRTGVLVEEESLIGASDDHTV